MGVAIFKNKGKAMNNQQRAQYLEFAKELILAVRDSFSTEKEVCECCGFERFKNWNERQLRDQLNGAVTRLENVEKRMLDTEGVEKHGPHSKQDKE
jgi:hypothetical protein